MSIKFEVKPARGEGKYEYLENGEVKFRGTIGEAYAYAFGSLQVWLGHSERRLAQLEAELKEKKNEAF